MAGITLTVDRSNIDYLFTSLHKAAGDLTPAMRAIGEHLITATQDRFDSMRDPEGKVWVPLHPDTLKKKRTRKILTESSRLRDSISYQADSREVRIGTNVIYAAIQQLGGRTPRGYIPPRPYLGVTDADRDLITEIVRGYLTQIMS